MTYTQLSKEGHALLAQKLTALQQERDRLRDRLAEARQLKDADEFDLVDETTATRAAGVPATLYHLGDQIYTSPKGQRIYSSVFYGVIPPPQANDTIQLVTIDELPDLTIRLTPALQFALAAYKHLLPL